MPLRCATPSASLTYCTSLVVWSPIVIFIESAVFTRQVQALLTDDEYAALQGHLALYPKAGAVIQRTGGLRKVRWASGRGKRGGVRVITFTRRARVRSVFC